MRTKLLGAFISALAITAFAALPASAMAQEVTLKQGNTTVKVGETLRAHSTNTVFTSRPNGQEIKCARTSIRGEVRTNPGARITFFNGGVFQNAAGGDQCIVDPSEGRLTARVENVTFRKDINLRRSGTKIEGRTEARFTFRIWDRAINPTEPIAACSYEGKFKVRSTVGSEVFHAESEEDATLHEGSSESCDPEGFLRGDFTLSRRDAKTRVITN